MINLNDLYNLTSKILTTDNIDNFKDNLTISIVVSKDNLKNIDDELYTLSHKPIEEYKQAEVVNVTIQGIKYNITTK